jgi:hypothetical protein
VATPGNYSAMLVACEGSSCNTNGLPVRTRWLSWVQCVCVCVCVRVCVRVRVCVCSVVYGGRYMHSASRW